MKLCLFDLDGTLIPGDSDHAFGQFMVTLGWADGEQFARRNDGFYRQYQAGTLDLAAYVDFATSAWRVRPEAEALAARERFMQEVMQPSIHEQALALVRAHQRAGDLVAIITATNEFVTAPIAAAFGVAELLAVQLERDAQGRVTGRVRGVPSFREGKVVRVHEWLAAKGFALEAFESRTVYSDSINDLALLEWASHPVATNPGAALEAIAHERGWRILRLFGTMIKKFIDRLLGKPAAKETKPRIPLGKRVDVAAAEHGIDPALLDERAVRVVSTLKEGGFEAYIVGGAVRDLLVGRRPKDFDVATNATPEEVKALFRRAFIIGRRFRIVHVIFGRGRDHEVVEVSTFRAYMEAVAAEAVEGNEKTSKAELAGKSHAVDASGRVLRDNVWGPQIEDAARRDFTINAMYYDPVSQMVVDYHGGLKDVKKRVLRMIGDPVTRYREDPVRIVRAVRFAAKLGFEIEPKTREPIREMAAALDNVPASRLFDETIKLLQTGHSLASVAELRKQGLERVFPILEVLMREGAVADTQARFIELALADTDRRVEEGRGVAPSFMLSCLLWHEVLVRWSAGKQEGVAPFPALLAAVDAVFDARIGDISGRGKLGVDMREIWTMQPRFERRSGSAPFALIEQPRFRAAYDFLRLRADAGEIDTELADWWEDFSLGTPEERDALIAAAREQPSARRSAPPTDTSAQEPAAAARKRRRRRRKPAAGSDAPAETAEAAAPPEA